MDPSPLTFYLVKPKLLALPSLPPDVSKNSTLSGALILMTHLRNARFAHETLENY